MGIVFCNIFKIRELSNIPIRIDVVKVVMVILVIFVFEVCVFAHYNNKNIFLLL